MLSARGCIDASRASRRLSASSTRPLCFAQPAVNAARLCSALQAPSARERADKQNRIRLAQRAVSAETGQRSRAQLHVVCKARASALGRCMAASDSPAAVRGPGACEHARSCRFKDHAWPRHAAVVHLSSLYRVHLIFLAAPPHVCKSKASCRKASGRAAPSSASRLRPVGQQTLNRCSARLVSQECLGE